MSFFFCLIDRNSTVLVVSVQVRYGEGGRSVWKAGLDCSIFGFAARRQPLILTYIIIADNVAAVNICELRSGRSQLAYDHPTFYI